ncbi:MAG: hypothetical protein HKN75_03905 [Bacteroidia bacterium]|nr:hypothetical protein [Bacteroidia bacterium]
MKLKLVESKKDIKAFLEAPIDIYKDDPNWVRPLDKDIEETFDRDKNKFFKYGDAVRWILFDDNGKSIGRVAAFYDGKTAKSFEQPTGGMGFYECIDNMDAANMLFNQCKDWLTEQGMEAMDGPINFGEKNKWWGLLVDGFTAPIYNMSYHLPYYRTQFEAFGFQTYYEQYCFTIPLGGEVPERYFTKAERISSKPGYHIENIKKSKLEKYAEDFRKIYNEAWVKYDNQKPMESRQAISIFKRLKPIIEPRLVYFAYFNNEPIAFFIMLPEINQIIRHLNGSFNWWAKLKFKYYQLTGECDRVFGLVFGVIPRYQGMGVEAFMIIDANKKMLKQSKYHEIELNWIGDFNPKMLKVAENLDAKIHRTYITMRVLFDQNKEYKRRPIMD